MAYMADTNVILRWAEVTDPDHPIVRAAADALVDRGETLWVCPQVLVEAWSVATRPLRLNGLGLSLSATDELVNSVETAFPLLPDTPDIHTHWRRLVVEAGVSGRQVHDARIVAVMLAHGVTSLLTLNTADFARYREITAVDPASL